MSKKGDELMRVYYEEGGKDGGLITELMPMANYIPQSGGSAMFCSTFSDNSYHANLNPDPYWTKEEYEKLLQRSRLV